MEHKAPFLLEFICHRLEAVGEHIGVPAIGSKTVVMSWVVILILIAVSLIVKLSLKPVPGRLQNIIEFTIESLLSFIDGMMGPKGRKFLPLFGTLTLFILLSNLIGLIPGLKAPTGDWSTTIALALVVFFSTHYFGIKERGLIGYIKHFVGPQLFLAPLMIPVHIIGEIARPFSLSIRLFVNMMSKHVIIGSLALLLVLFSETPKLYCTIIPLILPPFVMALGIITCLIQTFIFVLLAMIYISGAIESEEHE